MVGQFIEIKTGYQGFETKRNPVFHMLVRCIENNSLAYMTYTCNWKWLSRDIIKYVNMTFAQYKVKLSHISQNMFIFYCFNGHIVSHYKA